MLSKIDGQKLGDLEYLRNEDINYFLSNASSIQGQFLINLMRDILVKNVQEFARFLSHEVGKPMDQTKQEIARAIEVLDTEVPNRLEDSKEKILVIGSLEAPILQLSHILVELLPAYKKIVYKPSTKVGFTLSQIYKKLSESNDVTSRLLIAPMPKSLLDELLLKLDWDKIIAYNELKIENVEIESRAQKDKAILIDDSSDLEVSVANIIENVLNFEKFNTSRIQHIFVKREVLNEFIEKLKSKLDLGVKVGQADQLDVNFVDTFKAYQRANLKEQILELLSYGADIVYGSVENNITSPVVILCHSELAEYYRESVWAPIIFILPFDSIEALSEELTFFDKFEVVSYMSAENNSHLLEKGDFELLSI